MDKITKFNGGPRMEVADASRVMLTEAVTPILKELYQELPPDHTVCNQIKKSVRDALIRQGKLERCGKNYTISKEDIGLIRPLVIKTMEKKEEAATPPGWLPIKELSEISNKPSVVSRILEALVGTKADEPGFIGSYKNVGVASESRVYVSPELFGYVQDAVALQEGSLKPRHEHTMVSIVEALDHKIPYVLSLIDAIAEEEGLLASEIEYVDDGNGRRVLSVSNLVLNELKVRAKRPPQPGAPEKKGFV